MTLLQKQDIPLRFWDKHVLAPVNSWQLSPNNSTTGCGHTAYLHVDTKEKRDAIFAFFGTNAGLKVGADLYLLKLMM